MSKSVISKTTELTNLRKKYRRCNIFGAIGIALLVLLLYFAYVFIAIASVGYGTKGAILVWDTEWMKKLFVYFDTTRSLFDFSGFKAKPADLTNLWRLVTLGGVVILAVVLACLFGLLHGKHLNKKYRRRYQKCLEEEVRINGLTLETKVTDLDENGIKTALTRANIEKAERLTSLSLSSPSASWTGSQYTYDYAGKKRNGYLIQTNLSRSRTGGLIQFRTFGRPTMSEYESNEIKKYGFAENPKMSEYVCYTSLGQEIYTVIDSTVVDALYDFKQYVGCGIIVTLAGQSLTLFIDGFRLNMLRPLKEKLDSDFLEKQASAIAALHKCIGSLSNAFSADQFVIQSDDKSLV